MDKSRHYTVFHLKKNTLVKEELDLITEKYLALTIDNKPCFETKYTPGDEDCLAAGICFTKGIVRDSREIKAIEYPANGDINTVNVCLAETKQQTQDLTTDDISMQLNQKNKSSQMDIEKRFSDDNIRLTFEDLYSSMELLNQNQELHQKTRGAHAALLFDANLDIVSFAEDVARHNAFDKALGKALLSDRLANVRIAILSSRINQELLSKAISARIPVIAGISRPTAGVVDLGVKLNMTVICAARGEGFFVFCGPQRLMAS